MSDRFDDPNLCNDCSAMLLGEEYVKECFSSRKYADCDLCAGKYLHQLALRHVVTDVACRLFFTDREKYWEYVTQKWESDSSSESAANEN